MSAAHEHAQDPEHEDTIPMRDPSRGRDRHGRPMLTVPRRRLVTQPPRMSDPQQAQDPPAGEGA